MPPPCRAPDPAPCGAAQELAARFPHVRFLRLRVDAGPAAKALFKGELRGSAVPAFFFFRGRHLHGACGAAELERELLQHALSPAKVSEVAGAAVGLRTDAFNAD